MKTILGRVKEQQQIQELLNSNQSEFLGVYGRRRVGKTFLIRESLQNQSTYFEVSGTKDGSLQDQLATFTKQLHQTFPTTKERTSPRSWKEAFEILDNEIKKIRSTDKVVVFLDELPWLATKKSSLLQEIDALWNNSWSRRSNILFIVCGSAAAWMVRNIVSNKGGLHNRLTQHMHLRPLDLSETKHYLKGKGRDLTTNQIVELYMAIGGIPYYLDHAAKAGHSAPQIIDALCFTPEGLLRREYSVLFSSLFDQSERHYKIMDLLAKQRNGATRKELSQKVTGNIDRLLEELELAGFIKKYVPYNSKKRGSFYRIIDEYTLFYKHWIEPTLDAVALQDNHWLKKFTTPSFRSWSGYSFESLCQKHTNQILQRLGISGIDVGIASWRYSPKNAEESGAQIDLLLDRADRVISVGEIRYSQVPLTVRKDLYQKIKARNGIFLAQTKTTKSLNNFLIAANGVVPNAYSNELFVSVLTSEDLFDTVH